MSELESFSTQEIKRQDFLEPLGKHCKNLKVLKIPRLEIDDKKFLKFLNDQKHALNELEISVSYISIESFKAISTCQHLKKLSLSDNSHDSHEGLDDSEDWTYSSDHAIFYQNKIPFIYFGVADHNDSLNICTGCFHPGT